MRRSSSSPSVVRVNGTSSSSSSLPDEVQHLSYFHGDVASMQDVFSIVKKYINYDGHFLLRESFTKPGTLTVSVLHGRGVKHFNVAKQNGNYFLKDRLFQSINDLILHYRTHDVPNVEGITNVRLVTPIVSQSFETASVKSSGSCKMPGSHFQVQEKSNSRSRLSSHSTEKNINILSKSKPCQMHDSKTTSLNSFSQLSSCHSVFGNLQQSDELASSFASASSNSPDYLFGRLPPKKSSVRCHQRIPRPPPRSLPTEMAPNLYYSTVRDTYKELAPNLIKMLCEVESSEDERCICGLLYEEAELIMGWTMHLSTEPESEGKLFFMGPDGETAWQLPPEILLNLSVDHQHRIQELSRNNS